MRDTLFIVHRSNLWEDSWTYGDWRQYMCKRADGALQCARVSGLPLIIGALAFLVFGSAVMAMVTMPSALIAWERAIPAAVFGGLVLTGLIAGRLNGFVLMRAVGPRQYNGRRIFNHEVER